MVITSTSSARIWLQKRKKKNQWTKCRFMGKKKIDYQGEVRGKWKSNGLEITTMFGVEVFPNSA